MLGLFKEGKMIHLRRENIIIFTPHKCGSTTLNYIFTEAPNSNGILINGPQLGLPDIEKHTNVLPFEIQNRHFNKDKKGIIAIAVRNPYTRALSIYNHHLTFDNPKVDSFADFVKYRLVTGGHYFSQTLYSFCKTICTPIPRQLKPDTFWPNYCIHLETLEKDIINLGFDPYVIPIKNKTQKKLATLDDYTPETIALVRAWGEMDFNCFGYYHDFEKCDLVKEETSPLYVVPPRELMGPYGNGNIHRWLDTGRAVYSEMKQNVLKVCNTDIEDTTNVLDFGCKAGRVIRNFDIDNNICGVDTDKKAVDWYKNNSSYCVKAIKDFNLPFEDNYFNFIYALSVFTHIEYLKEWLNEVIRTLNKNGIFYISVQDESSVVKMMEQKNPLVKKKELDLEGFLQGKYPVIWDGFFSFVQRDYLLSLVPSSVELVGIGNSELFQTAYMFRKK
jgi:SAM-dependent methyltransferase